MRHLLLVIFCLVLITASSTVLSAGTPDIEQLGLSMQISGDGKFAIDPTTEGVIYFLDFIMGFYKSTDGGATWEKKPITPTENVIEFFRDIAVTDTPEDIIYITVTWDDIEPFINTGLWRSQDQGETWERVWAGSEKDECREIYLHPSKPDYLLALRRTYDNKSGFTQYNIWWSDDGGSTWQASTGIENRISSKIIFLTQYPDVCLGIFDYHLYISSDRGRSWTFYGYNYPGPMTGLAIDQEDLSRWYANFSAGSRWPGGTYISLDYGLTWTQLHEADKYSAGDLAADFSESISLYTERAVSNDGGITWKRTPWDLDQSAEVLLFTIDTHNHSRVYKTNNTGIAVTENRGQSWRHLAFTWPIYNTFQYPFNSQILFNGTSTSALLKSIDGGQTWITKGEGITVHDGVSWMRFPHDQPAIIYCGNDHAVYRSDDVGESWLPYIQGLYVSDFEIDPGNSQVMYLAYGMLGTEINSLVKTTDGGASWFVLRTPETSNVSDIQISPHNSNRLYGLLDYGRIIVRSFDGGAT